MPENNLSELTFGVTTLLGPEFRTSALPINLDDYLVEFPREVDLRQMNVFVEEAMNRFARRDRARSDAWLGPRLHHALRLTRQEAARRGVWLFLGVAARPDYVVWRWAGGQDISEDEPAGLDRFAGPDYKHALARLWWMAEVFRDGSDYGPAVRALQNQDVVNNLFRMRIAHHRPTALAAVSVLFPANDKPLVGREANALAKAANAAATTLQYDILASDPGLDEGATGAWLAEGKDVDAVKYFDELPPGPLDPPVTPTDIETMRSLFDVLLKEAPVRGRSSSNADAEPTEAEPEEGDVAVV
jgi:hypothetical protein